MFRLWLRTAKQLHPRTLLRCHGTSCIIFGWQFGVHSQNQTHYVYKIQLLAPNMSWTTQNMLDFQSGKLKCPQRVKQKPVANFQSILVLSWEAKSLISSTFRYFHSITKDRDGGNTEFFPVHPTVLRQDQLSLMPDCWLASTSDLRTAAFLEGGGDTTPRCDGVRWRCRKIKRFFSWRHSLS